jgi:transposase-like protein
MQGEMAEHLGYEKHDPDGDNSGNSRNGATLKTLKGDFGTVEIETPKWRRVCCYSHRRGTGTLTPSNARCG